MNASSIAPIVPTSMQVLILGSVPGQRSLAANQYYAHPRNLFWSIMHDLLGVPPTAPYEERLAQLGACGVGLWDVLQEAHRPGSLDANIVAHTEIANDIGGLMAHHPTLAAIAFNGQKAAASFHKHVVTKADAQRFNKVELLPLPSTSPANARIPYAQKLEAWRAILDYLPSPHP